MRTYTKKSRPAIKNCGSRRGKGGCNWGGATKGQTKIKVAA
jgi:hypothetical protein